MVTQQSFSKNKKAVLILEDATIFRDHSFGSTENSSNEVVFSTSMVGHPKRTVEININESGDNYAAT